MAASTEAGNDGRPTIPNGRWRGRRHNGYTGLANARVVNGVSLAVTASIDDGAGVTDIASPLFISNFDYV